MVTFSLKNNDSSLEKIVWWKTFSNPKDIITLLEDFMLWKIMESSEANNTNDISILEKKYLWK